MRNKKSIILLCAFVSVFLLASYTVYKKTSGSHPGSTGAPLDLTCAQGGCHTTASITYSAVNNNTLTFSSVDSSYVPGQTYSITVKVTGSSPPNVKFGFELGALKDKDSLNVGQFVITDAVRTQIITHPIGTDLRYSMTHKAAGTPSLSFNYSEWKFNWTAPPTNEGNITFWYATNCTNNNGQNTGDKIFLHSFQIHPKPFASVKEIADEYDLNLYYDKDSKEILVSYDLKGDRQVQLNAFDNLGKLIYKGSATKLSGKQKQRISIGSNLSEGAYLIQIQIDDRAVTKKVLVN